MNIYVFARTKTIFINKLPLIQYSPALFWIFFRMYLYPDENVFYIRSIIIFVSFFSGKTTFFPLIIYITRRTISGYLYLLIMYRNLLY